MRATLVIPTLNEAGSIGHVLESFRAAAETGNRTLFAADPIDWEILVVDGASTDGTATRAQQAGATVLNEPRKGYGRAYKTGFERARGEVIATADGDATYPVEEIPKFVRQLLDSGADFLTGNRMAFLDRKAMTTEHRIGNGVLNTVLGVLFHRYLRDLPDHSLADSQSGFWIFRRSLLDRVSLVQDGMAFSEELKIEVLLRGARFVEVPIRYGERWGSPKLSSWRDGYANLRYLFRKRFAVQRELRTGAPQPFRSQPTSAVPPP